MISSKQNSSARVLLTERLEPRVLFTAFGGVDFPQGISSFADAVISYAPAKPANIAADAKHPVTALGAPDGKNVSLGQGGSITLGFTDNVLTNSSSKAKDLWVFEVGPDVESTFVFAHPTPDTKPLLPVALDLDGDGYYAVGEIKGSTRGVDLDAAIPGFVAGKLRFDAVLLTDDPNQGGGGTGSPGADINSVGAITSSAVLPLVTVEATTPKAAETGPKAGVFTFTRTGPLGAALTLDYGIGGTAANVADYAKITSPVTFAIGQRTTTVTIKPVDDTTIEGDETVKLTLTPASRYAIDPAKASAVVTIIDNDKPLVGISAIDPFAAENVAGLPSAGLFRVERTVGPITSPLTVKLTLSGTAAITADFSVTVSGAASSSYNAATKTLTITLAAGKAAATIIVTPKNDAATEPAETVVLTLAASPSYLISPTKVKGTVTIEDESAF